MEYKVPPHNLEAEQSILSNILIDQNCINDVIGIIKPDDFYDSKNRIIYNTMLKMYQDDINIDVVTLGEQLQPRLKDIGGMLYLGELFKGGVRVNVKDYATIVKEKSNKRSISNIAYDLYNAAFDDNQSSRDVMINTEDKLFSLSVNRDKKLATAEEAINSTLEQIEKNYKNGGGIVGIKTGFYDIDKSINGLLRGDYIVIAARPSMGKTALALRIAANVSEDYSAAFFSLEMKKEKLMQRILSTDTMIRLENIKQGRLSDDSFTKIVGASAEISRRKLMIDDTSEISIQEIKAECKKLKIKQGLDVVVVDHIGLIESGERTNSREQELSKISRQLKKMANELDISVIILCQLNRGPEARDNKRPRLSDLRESGAVEQDADVVLMLYRDDYYNADSSKKGIVECIINKNRDGAVGTVELGWLAEFQKFRNLDNGRRDD
ncbi:replicative DNA helicase [Oxobacter pfennigii]|uniref:Replicative DNA helicase n=1 Tax=Oxobacter pfennigii TaxID=36849 RepID=A0A0P9AAX2_9CLOT|nr:replicative DNA helicase [Oxobacter pfennigii]KPU42181.1 replicative DNA helicase [Oxobacter pfennigii]